MPLVLEQMKFQLDLWKICLQFVNKPWNVKGIEMSVDIYNRKFNDFNGIILLYKSKRENN